MGESGPQPPTWFDERAAAVWARTCGQLRELGALHAADQDTLVGYVRAVLEHEDAAKLVDTAGVLIKGANGEPVRNPAVMVEAQSRVAVLRSGRALGLIERDRPASASGRVGRGERALNEDLRAHTEVGPSERAALRACARALDQAEADTNLRLVVDVSKVYLEVRRAAGLTAGDEQPAAGSDPFVAFAAGLSAAGVGNAAHRE
jgi:P27 family predicted phage terminase small subunit